MVKTVILMRFVSSILGDNALVERQFADMPACEAAKVLYEQNIVPRWGLRIRYACLDGVIQ